jgi:hypothetical protein
MRLLHPLSRKARKPGRHTRGHTVTGGQDATAPTAGYPPLRPFPGLDETGEPARPDLTPWHDRDATAPFPAPPSRRPGERLLHRYLYFRGAPAAARAAVPQERAVIGDSIPGATGMLSLRCACGRSHGGPASFAALYESARESGWRQAMPGSPWRCARCARRDAAYSGARPVAAIEAAPVRKRPRRHAALKAVAA